VRIAAQKIVAKRNGCLITAVASVQYQLLDILLKKRVSKPLLRAPFLPAIPYVRLTFSANVKYHWEDLDMKFNFSSHCVEGFTFSTCTLSMLMLNEIRHLPPSLSPPPLFLLQTVVSDRKNCN
jgi:hypothetical protein